MNAPDHKAVNVAGAGVNDVLANLRREYPQDGAVVDGYIRRLEAAVIAQSAELEKLRQRCGGLEAAGRRVTDAFRAHGVARAPIDETVRTRHECEAAMVALDDTLKGVTP